MGKTEGHAINEVNVPKVDSTLSKGLSILEALGNARAGKGVTELSIELGLSKSNTFRLLQSLTALGYVRRNLDKSYSATLKTWQVGCAMLDNLNLREISAPEMNYLSIETGEAIYLAIPENLSVVYIDKLDSPKNIRSWHPIGGSAPMHCVGTGKAILAENYGTLRLQVSGRLTRYTDLTITSLPELDVDIETTRRRGYAYGQGEFRDGILSFGAAITLPGGEAIAALSVSFPVVNMPDKGPEWVGSLVANAAESVSAKLRHF